MNEFRQIDLWPPCALLGQEGHDLRLAVAGRGDGDAKELDVNSRLRRRSYGLRPSCKDSVDLKDIVRMCVEGAWGLGWKEPRERI